MSGVSVWRSHHALATPNDEMVAGLASEYLFGANLLVAPVTVPAASGQAVLLPDGIQPNGGRRSR